MPATLDGVILHSQGRRLLGSFFRPAADGPCPTVLLLHGIPGVEKNLDLAYALRDAGWNVLTFHYRGCWGSEGNYTLPGILDDISAALDYLSQHPAVDPRHLAGVGLSLGGWGVISAAARDERLRAIVSINPLVDGKARPLADKEAAEWASMLNGITPAEVQAQWAALTPLPQVAGKLAGRPTLLLTGDADELFDFNHQRPLAEAMPFAEWRRIPGASHTFNDHRTVMVRTVVDWLTRTFSPLSPLPDGFTLRIPVESDHARVLAVLSDWWGGRDLSHLLPRLYFQHFNDTSFIVEKDGALAAFLIGFMSQSEPGAGTPFRVGYIHFVGVHPEHRKAGLGRALYERFFEVARARGAREVHCITGPVNAGSIAFHTRMRFVASESIADYDGPEDNRVAFKKRIG
jgi:pimeloyl-ACP methyl ester carboxylesterase/ribosomal protein S18 acetylase RimI-like enzyme